MNKIVLVMCIVFHSSVQWSIASTIEVVMHVDSEVPCLRSELLSGTIDICNNSSNDIKLLKGTKIYPDIIVHEQVYLFPKIPIQKEIDILAGHGMPGGQPSRATIKDQVGSYFQNPEATITLKKGETLTIEFANREISASILSFTRERIPFAGELYLPPNNWIPIDIRPVIEIACDAKIIPVSASKKEQQKSTWVFRARLGTNEFLCANLNFSTHRLLDINLDDTVCFSNKTVTVKQKSGRLHTIPECDIPKIIENRRHEIRKTTK